MRGFMDRRDCLRNLCVLGGAGAWGAAVWQTGGGGTAHAARKRDPAWDKAIDKGLKYLMNYLPGKGAESGYYFYGHYYACQAMWHAGGNNWTTWYTAIRDRLLQKQGGDGSWTDDQAGSEFGTAMGCIILQMPNNYLPVFSP